MRKRTIFLFVFLSVWIAQSVCAQSFLVKGQVTSKDDNEPLIGVAVVQEGTTNGITTDFDGNYALEIKGTERAKLVFSYVGMKSQEHFVDAHTNVLNVVMQSDTEMMDEVVVVAYGVRKKGTIAGSVSTVKADKMENVPAAGFDQALQGQTPGLMVLSNSGEPSKAATFQIRGTNSINSGTSPLFILDGVPISSADFNTISPSDIESVSVLKDASSTSIYGARAANGVVVITTKRGTALDNAKVVLRSQWGFSELASNNWSLMNTDERIQFEKEIGIDAGQDYDVLRRTDINWQEAVFNDRAMLQNYDLSISRATDKLNYFVSGSFYDQEGIAQGSTFRRYNLRANADVKAMIAKWLETYEDLDASTPATEALVKVLEQGGFTAEEQKLVDEILKRKKDMSKKTMWMYGGDGWAYDIGYGGLDHVFAMGEDVNVLLVDTEVYSNTGGQSSKATPVGAVAQFQASGKKTQKKDLGALMMTYDNVYVAQCSMGANPNQLIKAIREAEAHKGPSLIICYAPCINHGIKKGMGYAQQEMKDAVASGYWNLYRYDPATKKLTMDSKEPTMPLYEFMKGEVRYASLELSFPDNAKELFAEAEANAKEKYEYYKRRSES